MLQRFFTIRKLTVFCALMLLFFAAFAFMQTPITRAQAKTPTLVVAQDGSGDFTTVQAAVDAVPSGNQTPVIIYVKDGTYQEVVTVPADKPFITLIGQDEKRTIITYNNYHGEAKPDGGTFGTGDSASVFVKADDFTALNLTLQNTAGNVGQAVALNATGDRGLFVHCQFLGWQDTLYAHTGRQYYLDDYVDGRVDYVFGDATAVFDHSEFYSVAGNGATVTAQRRMTADETTGYVFTHDKIDGAIANSTYLGRPWGPYARVIVLYSWLGSNIEAAGWENWSTADYHLTAYYAEYHNMGPGADTAGRISWSHQLTDQEAQQFTINNFLNQDGWLTHAEQNLIALLLHWPGSALTGVSAKTL